MRNILFLSFFLFFFVGCIKLGFDGNTFYTVTGRITDTTNKAIQNMQVSIFNYVQGGMFVSSDSAVSAVCYTDVDGNYKLTFPSSTGDYYLRLQNGFVLRDTTGNPDYPYEYYRDIPFDTSSFKNYFYQMNTIKVLKQ